MRARSASPYRCALHLTVVATATLLVGGCSISLVSPEVASPGLALTGRVRGGNQAVSNSRIYLYAAGTGGYGTSARSMINGAGYVTTGSDGSFSITGDYTCQAGDQVYLLALGGNPGLSAGTNNAALALMAALGPCNLLSPSTYIIDNEVTTVAAGYALAGFMNSATQLSSSGTALAQTGVVNAFKNAANLVSFATGTANTATAGGNGSVPTSELNSLGNILAACVNSDGTGSPCSTLFAATTPSGGSAPTDTLQAALNIAHNPGLNVSSLFTISQANAPFQPALSTAPHDWSVSVSYTGGGLSYTPPYVTTYSIAVDAIGNIWLAGLSAISEYDPTGTALSPSNGYLHGGITGYSFTSALAIDSSNSAWVGLANSSFNAGRIAKLSSTGSVLSPSGGYFGGGLASNAPNALAFDSSGNLWVAPSGPPDNVAEFNSSGTALSPSTGYAPEGGDYGAAATADTSGHVWVGSTEYSSSGSILTTNSPCSSVEAETMAIDRGGHLWAMDGSALFECNANGTALTTNSGYNANMVDTEGTAVDGDDRVWYFSYSGPTALGVMSDSGTAISPSGGYQNAILATNSANYFAIDGSGNVWVASDGIYVVEYVGIASPVITPLATATAGNKLATRP